MLALTLLALAAALVVTGWALFAVPLTLPVAYGAWLGLTDAELHEVLDHSTGGDLGHGPAGASPW